MPIAHVNNVNLYYETHGSGFPLIFSHGGMGGLGSEADGSVPAWVADFSKHFTVILYDRRSNRRSEFPRTSYTMKDLATDALELLHFLGYQKAHKWGSSSGGPMALEFAHQFPEATQSLMIPETSPKFWDENVPADRLLMERLHKRLDILRAQGEEAAYDARRTDGNVGFQAFREERAIVTENDAARREARRAGLLAQLQSVPREERMLKYAGELRNYEAVVDWTARPWFRELKMPIMIPYSLNDTQVPNARWDELSAGMPNVVYAPVSGVDHGGTMNTPGMKDRMVEFLLQNTP